jgi:DNA polymerase-3 subunit delta'
MIFIKMLLCQNRCSIQEPNSKVLTEEPREGSVPSEGYDPCGECLSCKKIESGNHPDFTQLILAPDETSIKMEAIAAMQEQLIYAPIESVWKIVLIDPADKITMQAQNSLLKTIEEPPDYAIIILIASKIDLLAPTLVSRCQRILFSPLALSQIETILMERNGWTQNEARFAAAWTGGNLGESLTQNLDEARQQEIEYNALVNEDIMAHYESLFETAKTFSGSLEKLEKALYYLSAYFRDLLVLHAMGGSVPSEDLSDVDESYLVFFWRKEELIRWARRMTTQEVTHFLADTTEMTKNISRNINKQLALETLLMQMRDKLLEGTTLV